MNNESKELMIKELQSLRKKVLNLNKMNPLIDLNYKKNDNKSIHVIDEKADFLYNELYNKEKIMLMDAIPYLKESQFKEYLEFDPSFISEENFKNKQYDYERIKTKANKEWVAKKHNINNSINLEKSVNAITGAEDKHIDNKIQTFLYQHELRNICKNLKAKNKNATEEKGIHSLYLSFGILEWKNIKGEIVKSPLILLPVNIKEEQKSSKGLFKYEINYNGSDILFNFALKEKIFQEIGFKIPDIDTYKEEDIDFMPENYIDYLETIIKKEDLNWEVINSINIMLCDSKDIILYNDLDHEKWDNEYLFRHDLIRKILDINYIYKSKKHEVMSIHEIDNIEEKYPLVVEADSSQYEAVIEAMNGQSMVIQGPPGTGKSQTITNLIAGFLRQDKKVLFVGEKAAAISVVKNNLKEKGLEKLVLDLHGESANKKKVAESLKERIEEKDSINKIPRNDSSICKEIDNNKNYIYNYYKKINEETLFEKSFNDIIFISKLYYKNYNKEIDYENIDFNEKLYNKKSIKDAKELLRKIIRNIADIKEKNYISNIQDSIWFDIDFHNQIWSDKKFKSLEQELIKIESQLRSNDKEISSYFNVDIKINDILFLKNITKQAINFPEIKTFNNFNKLEQHINLFKLISVFVKENNIEKIDSIKNNMLQIENILSTINRKIFDEHQEISKTKNDIENYIKLEKQIENFKQYIQNFNNILGVEYSDKSNEKINEFMRCYLLINSLEKQYINKRNKIYESSDFNDFKKQLIDDLEFFNVLKNELNENLINLKELKIKIKNYKKDIVRIKNTKALSFLKKDYRQAKKRLQGIYKDKQKMKPKELYEKSLSFLLKIENLLNFENNIEYNKLGVFSGVETNIKEVEHIKDWYNGIRNEYKLKDRVLYKKIIDLSDENFFEIKDNEYIQIEKLVKLLQNKGKDKIYQEIKEHKADYENIKVLNDLLDNHLSIYFIEKELPEIKRIACFESILFTDFSEKNKNKQVEIEYLIKNIKDTFIQNEFQVWTDIILTNPDDFMPLLEGFKETTKKIDKSLVSIGEDEVLNQDIILDYKNYSLENITTMINQMSEEIAIKKLFNRLRVNEEEFKNQFKEIKNVLEPVINNKIKLEESEDLIISSLAYPFIKEILSKDEILKEFNSTDYNHKVEELKTLLNKNFKENVDNILQIHNEKNIEQGIKANSVRNTTGLYFIKNEANKKNRHFAIRTLLKNSWNSLIDLKPCFMMSPTTVSQYLSKENMNFDVLIIDEASQMFPENALPAIARSEQMIIVGDSNQLPPASHFMTTIENSDNEDSLTKNTESILELANEILESKTSLKWHYRSKHPSLIQYSNKNFYDNKLQTFPAMINGEDSGIKSHYIENGYNSKGVNKEEAQAVVEKFVQDIKRNPNRSYGIVAINVAQSEWISGLVDEERTKDSKFSKIYKDKESSNEPIFIKNLENVQGDERDVIYISFVYGKDKDSHIVMNRFGEINKKNGWRYLNVLFSRAKEKMEVFYSLKPSDIKLKEFQTSETSSKEKFKKLIQFVDSGHEIRYQLTGREPDSPFEIDVIEELENAGYQCVPQVGMANYFIDIGVRHPENNEEFLLGIECDGATYHSSYAARDNDLLRQQVLESLGWKIHRIWSTDWFNNKDVEIQKILTILEKKLKI